MFRFYLIVMPVLLALLHMISGNMLVGNLFVITTFIILAILESKK